MELEGFRQAVAKASEAGANLRTAEALAHRVARDLSAEPQCAVALEVVQKLAPQLPLSWSDLWNHRHEIVELSEVGMGADQIIENALKNIEREVTVYGQYTAWDLFRRQP